MPKWHAQLELKVNQLDMTPEGPVVIDATVYTTGGAAYGSSPEEAIRQALEKLRGFCEQLMLPKTPPGGES